MGEPQETAFTPMEVDPEGIGELFRQADAMPPALRPPIGPTLDHQMAAQAYMAEMDEAKYPQLGPWQELQLAAVLEEADRQLAGSDAGPLAVYELEGPDPKPRDAVLLNGWVALMHRDKIAYIQDLELGTRRFVSRLVIFRH